MKMEAEKFLMFETGNPNFPNEKEQYTWSSEEVIDLLERYYLINKQAMERIKDE